MEDGVERAVSGADADAGSGCGGGDSVAVDENIEAGLKEGKNEEGDAVEADDEGKEEVDGLDLSVSFCFRPPRSSCSSASAISSRDNGFSLRCAAEMSSACLVDGSVWALFGAEGGDCFGCSSC